jgi:transcriptional regulator with XRE-family HTH domain
VAPEKAFFARVGKRIREVRLARGLSQHQVAEAIRSYQQNVARTERGTENLTLDVIYRIAVALDVDPVEFFQDETPAKKTTRKTTPKKPKKAP